MPVIRNASFVATCPDDSVQANVGLVEHGTVVWEGDSILWVGPEASLPSEYHSLEQIDVRGAGVIPGLIDCHTHLAFGGWREGEFEQRILGVSYLEIAQRGGGILSTVEKTRIASEESLLALCRDRLREMNQLGVTTVECKSGYGLDRETELKILRVYKKAQQLEPTNIISTYLGAHTVPQEFRHDRKSYIQLVLELAEQIASETLASFCDIFIEESAFTVIEAREILTHALQQGLQVKVHSDQLSNLGGTQMAAELGALSADHLEQISQQGIDALKRSGTVAVSLPLASLYTFQPPLDARKLIQCEVPVAVATDFNPGSAPSSHLPLALLLACTLNRMTPAEALKGATIYAARALGIASERGSIEPGKKADICVLTTPNVEHWLYNFGEARCQLTIVNGSVAFSRM
ncbi:MAG: imidazolonepropionase [Bdellovibrionales bacterium]|nr:imidazolonepropionase [Bdellovibrionales bacterium]